MTLYRYSFKNCAERQKLFGRICTVIARLAMNSCIIEFENGQQECVSRNALRKVAQSKEGVNAGV